MIELRHGHSSIVDRFFGGEKWRIRAVGSLLLLHRQPHIVDRERFHSLTARGSACRRHFFLSLGLYFIVEIVV